MTTEGDPLTQEVDAAQEGLTKDAPQQPPGYVSEERLREMLAEQTRGFQDQTTRFVNRALDAIRRDSVKGVTEAVRKEIMGLQADARRTKIMEQVPEEHREWVKQVMVENLSRSESSGEAPAPESQESEDSRMASVLLAVRDDLEAMGIDPNDKRIGYAALLGGDRKAFLSSLREIRGQVAAPAAKPAPPAAAPATRRQPGPPVETAAPAASGFRNADDVMDALISGRLGAGDEGKQKYRELMAKFGHQV